MAKSKIGEVGGEVPSNGGAKQIEMTMPYRVEFILEGVSDMLFHRWNVESVDTKARAAKGSEAKKTDDVESYVYRTPANELGIPGEYVRGSMINAAKFRQDPRSPRKSAMDLFKAGIVALTPLASVGKVDWDYLDTRRCMIQRNGVNRTRPALKAGWHASFVFMVNLPEYIHPQLFHEVLMSAGRLVGLADFRPTYGRFSVIRFEVLTD